MVVDWAAVLLRGRPWAAFAALAVAAGATERLARLLPVREPRRTTSIASLAAVCVVS